MKTLDKPDSLKAKIEKILGSKLEIDDKGNCNITRAADQILLLIEKEKELAVEATIEYIGTKEGWEESTTFYKERLLKKNWKEINEQ